MTPLQYHSSFRKKFEMHAVHNFAKNIPSAIILYPLNHCFPNHPPLFEEFLFLQCHWKHPVKPWKHNAHGLDFARTICTGVRSVQGLPPSLSRPQPQLLAAEGEEPLAPRVISPSLCPKTIAIFKYVATEPPLTNSCRPAVVKEFLALWWGQV